MEHLFVDVHLLDTETGERRVCAHDFAGDPSSLRSAWSEGFYGCDCARGRLFDQAAGIEAVDDLPCGEDRYWVEMIVRRGSEAVLYADDPASRTRG